MIESLKHLIATTRHRPAARGAVWTVIGFGGTQVLRLVSSLTLTRLLFPEAFGLMALISSFMVGLELLSDAGIRQSIIRSPRGDQIGFLRSAWSIQVVRGVLLLVCAIAIAYPVAIAYQERDLLYFLPVSALGLLLAGLRSPSIALSLRRLEYRGPTLIDLGSTTIGIASTIALSAVFPSVWSLIVGNLAATTASVVASHLLMPPIALRFSVDAQDVREIVNFGKWVLSSSAMFFLASQADRLILGQLLAFALLGSYSIADQLSRLPRMAADQLAGQVAFSVFSRTHREEPQALGPSLARIQGYMDFFVAMSGLLAAWSVLLVDLLYDHRYADAGWMLSVLSLRSAISCAGRAASNCLVASGRPQWNAAEQAISAVSLIVISLLGWKLGGTEGLVLAIALSEVPAYLLLQVGLIKHGYFNWLSPLRTVACGALGYGIGLWVVA